MLRPEGLIPTDHILGLIDHYVDFFLHSTKVDPAGEPYVKNLGAVLTCESIERSLAMFVILLSQSKDGAASLLRMWHAIPDQGLKNLTKIIGISVASC